jgi:hypothetical protein
MFPDSSLKAGRTLFADGTGRPNTQKPSIALNRKQ